MNCAIAKNSLHNFPALLGQDNSYQPSPSVVYDSAKKVEENILILIPTRAIST